MFGNFQRHDNRKQRLSTWFAREREGDMQALDVRGLFSGIAVYLNAVLKERAQRRPPSPDARA